MYSRIWPISIVGVICLQSHAAVNAREVKESNRAVAELCNETETSNRGLAASPFSGGASRYIVGRLLTHRSMKELLGISEDKSPTSGKIVRNPNRSRSATAPKGGVTFLDSSEVADAQYLNQAIPAERRGDLASLYLELEGLMALRRDVVAEAVEIDGEHQRRIETMANDRFEEAAVHHRAIFTDAGAQGEAARKAATLEHQEALGKLAASLDREIAKTLDKRQTDNVAALIDRMNKMKQQLKVSWPDAPAGLFSP